MILQNYEVKFEYIPGRKNTAADTLPQNISSQTDTSMKTVCNVQDLIVLNEEAVRNAQMEEKFSREIIRYNGNPEIVVDVHKLPARLNIHEFVVSYNLIYRVTQLNSKDLPQKEVKQLVVPQKLVPEILKILHDSPESSHPRKEKTYKQAQMKYFWVHMRKDIYDYVNNSKKCSETKGSTRSPAPMLNYPVPDGP